MKDTLTLIGGYLFGVALVAAGLIVIGALARGLVTLFCIGYVC